MSDERIIRLAHVSDLHPTGVLPLSPGLFLGKRVLGVANLLLRRNRRHDRALLERTAEDLRADPPDHLLLGGDVVNLGLDAEFAVSRAWLASLGLPPEAISAVPGNHDRYTEDAEKRRLFELYFGAFAGSVAPFPGDLFPFLQLRPGFAVIGLCSGRPASPIQARGTLGEDQLRRLEVLLGHPAARGPLVVLVHHPPLPYPDPLHQWLNGLHDWRRLIGLLAGTNALLLHGHRHLSLHAAVVTPRGTLRVIGVPSASDRGTASERTRGYHRYRLGPGGYLGGERRIWDEARGAFTSAPLPEPDTVRLEELK